MRESDYYLVKEIIDDRFGLHAFISIKNLGGKGKAFGATRIRKYTTPREAKYDSMLLAKCMAYKSSFIDSGYGGAKGVIMESPKFLKNRARALNKYAEIVEELNGLFITGTDMGLSLDDITEMNKYTQYLVGFNSTPELYTALGLKIGMDELIKHSYDDSSTTSLTLGIEGIGKVGSIFLKQIQGHFKTIYITDTNQVIAQKTIKLGDNITYILPDEFNTKKFDVFSPCAIGGTVQAGINTKVVAGCANNQLVDEATDQKLFDRGITYAPDFIINSGGLISVIDEYEHNEFNEDRTLSKLNNIARSLNEVILYSRKNKIGTQEAAYQIGDKLI